MYCWMTIELDIYLSIHIGSIDLGQWKYVGSKWFERCWLWFLTPNRCLTPERPLSSRNGAVLTKGRFTARTHTPPTQLYRPVKWHRWTWCRIASLKEWAEVVETEWLSRWQAYRTCPTHRLVMRWVQGVATITRTRSQPSRYVCVLCVLDGEKWEIVVKSNRLAI